jgi:hypothetical protein
MARLPDRARRREKRPAGVNASSLRAFAASVYGLLSEAAFASVYAHSRQYGYEQDTGYTF